MSKSIKILSIILIIFSLIINFYGVYASDINMNLLSNSNDASLNEQLADNPEESQVPVTETTDDTNYNQDVQDSTVSPTSVGTVAEDSLGASNIISILLIAVGVVLILLAIAIIIRLK